MEGLRRKHLLIIAVLTVLICSWAVGNIVQSTLDSRNETDSGEETTFERWNDEIVFAALILMISIVPASGIYIFKNKKGKAILSSLLLLGFWITTFLGATILVLLSTYYLSRDFGFFWFPSEEELQFLPFIGKLSLWILLILTLSLFLFLAYLKISSSIREKRAESGDIQDKKEWDFEEEEEVRRERIGDDLSSTVDSAITELSEGQDIRTTILDTYREMCRILEESGEENDEFLTPREFEKAVTENVPDISEFISEITHLFEEARYSPHDLKEEERKKAVEYLQNLKRRLR